MVRAARRRIGHPLLYLYFHSLWGRRRHHLVCQGHVRRHGTNGFDSRALHRCPPRQDPDRSSRDGPPAIDNMGDKHDLVILRDVPSWRTCRRRCALVQIVQAGGKRAEALAVITFERLVGTIALG